MTDSGKVNIDNNEEKNKDKDSSLDGEMSRRDLVSQIVKTGAGALALALGGGLVASIAGAAPAVNAETKAKRKYRFGMVVDTKRCVGCKACVVACKAENKTPPGVFNNVLLENPDKKSVVDKPIFMTRPCFHCENPPCVPVCPVDATFKRASDGVVVVDYDLCQGAGDCVKACPYGARTIDDGNNYPAVEGKTPYSQVPSPEYNQFRPREGDKMTTGKVRKCTFCVHLQDQDGRYDKSAGRWPACSKTCTGHAIFFGDFNDPKSEVSQLLKKHKAIRLKEELQTLPNVYYLV
ncbi:4Fe-4S dicluster domain-containing protein [Bdellovibrionota bacterium FG-2]